jgi:5-methylcytosine-specific restriction enzyme A
MNATYGFAERLSSSLTSRLGIALEPVGKTRVRISDIPPPNGFSIELVQGWRRLEAKFQPDNYGGHLIRSMGAAPSEAKEACSGLIDGFSSLSARVSISVNGKSLDDPRVLPPPPWTGLELSVSKLSAAEGEETFSELLEMAAACLSILLSLLPVDDGQDAELDQEGVPEGAKTQILVNRYERSAVNRAACIARFGARCRACDFSFEDRYGSLGAGYIEVHHTTPVSELGPNYVINPFVDLVPLCANCHAIVHRVKPPLRVEDLRRLLEGTAS